MLRKTAGQPIHISSFGLFLPCPSDPLAHRPQGRGAGMVPEALALSVSVSVRAREDTK